MSPSLNLKKVPAVSKFTGHRLRGDRYLLAVILVVMTAVYSLLLPGTFFTVDTFRVIGSSQSVLVVVSLGVLLPFSAGEFDLAFGSVLAWSMALLAVLTATLHVPSILAIIIVLASCAAWGAVNAMFIVKVGISSLITTLGSGTLIAGLTLAITHSAVVVGGPGWLASVATANWIGIPSTVYLAFIMGFVMWLYLEHTPSGRYIYFTGAGPDVARLSGLPVGRIKTTTLIASAVIAGVAGIVNLAYLGSADPNLGSTYMLPGTAAVFLGATTIKPGRFNAWGTVIAVYVLAVGVTGLQLLGGAGWVENVFNGAALIFAVSFAHLARKRSDNRA